ncbi:MAG: hypothetical protein H6624_18385 [Bdellovibrionaceae bacterium]|nr:hypothetical protein [Bdellovibrionales bacterium]MCB9086313.1 hypothetical protein [Pseudobdellovibrionaceae bacterium]
MSVDDLIPKQWRDRVKVVDLASPSTSPQEGSAVLGLTDQTDDSSILEHAIGGLQHICQVNGVFFNQEVKAAAQILVSPQDYLNFPVTALLRPGFCSQEVEDEICVFSRSFSGSGEKDQVLADFVEWSQTISKSGSFVDEIKSVADELVMNAVYNAPFLDSQGVREDVSLESDEVKSGRGRQATLFAGVFEKQLVIGCRDDWGTLKVDRLLQRIKGTLDKGVAENMNMEGRGGAGIGSYMIYNAGVSYYAGVDIGKRTVVCCKVPLGMSNRKRSEEPKNLHFFEIGE